MHHMAKDTHIALAHIKCTLTKERNKQQSDRKGYTQLTTNYRYCMTLFFIRCMGAATTGSGSEFQILTVRGTNEYIYAFVWANGSVILLTLGLGVMMFDGK